MNASLLWCKGRQQLAKSISRTMACSLQKQPSQPSSVSSSSGGSTSCSVLAQAAGPARAQSIGGGVGGGGALGGIGAGGGGGQRGSLQETTPPLEFQWPPMPVSSHTSNLHLTMMNQDPKDLHTARLIIEELRAKVRYQTEHIMKWRKAYAMQIQQHYRYQKEKTDQMNSLTSQLLLLESRLKRKQKQISSIINHRELTIQRQQKIIDTLSTRLLDHGLETIDPSYTAELDSLNDSDSAVVLEDIDSDCTMTLSSLRRRSSGAGCGGGGGGGSSSDGVTIVRSISDAIETNLANKYGGGARRNNCFLRRPDILETVYSVEEDPEPTSDVAEKRDKFKNRSEKALSSSSTEGQIDNVGPATTNNNNHSNNNNPAAPASPTAAAGPTILDPSAKTVSSPQTASDAERPPPTSRIPALATPPDHADRSPQSSPSKPESMPVAEPEPQLKAQAQVTNYNRVMSNHRSVTKPKDVKYKRINKAKSKSLEELRGRLKNLVERGGAIDGHGHAHGHGMGGGYAANALPPTAQSYA